MLVNGKYILGSEPNVSSGTIGIFAADDNQMYIKLSDGTKYAINVGTISTPSYNFSNGLTYSTTNVKLGGVLEQSTSIDTKPSLYTFQLGDTSALTNSYFSLGNNNIKLGLSPFFGNVNSIEFNSTGNKMTYTNNIIGGIAEFNLTGSGSKFRIKAGLNAGSYFAEFNTVSLTADRSFTYPNSSGTIALSSDLNSYLPLSGGTMSGSVNFGTASGYRLNGISKSTPSLGSLSFNNYIGVAETAATLTGVAIRSELSTDSSKYFNSVMGPKEWRINSQYTSGNNYQIQATPDGGYISMFSNYGVKSTNFYIDGASPRMSASVYDGNTSKFGALSIYVDGLYFNASDNALINYTVKLRSSLLTNTRIFQFPDTDGTIALAGQPITTPISFETQTTSKTTTVNLTAVAGNITTVALTDAAGTFFDFSITGTYITGSSIVILTPVMNGGTGIAYVTIVAGSPTTRTIRVYNIHPTDPFNLALSIHYLIIN